MTTEAAPTVTEEQINNIVIEEHYFTARQGAEASGGVEATYNNNLDLLTFCVLVLRNGFTVAGESACAHPARFNAELGKKYAREKAVEKIWQLEGYLLKEELYHS